MGPPITASPSRERASTFLAGALVALPLLQALPIDFDRTAPLVLLLPALWSGRAHLASACEHLARLARWLQILLLLTILCVVASVALGDHPAPAAVTAASWVFIASAALLAGQLIRADPLAQSRLLTAIAVGAVVGTLITWILWIAGGRGPMPLYAHHRHLGLHALAGACATTALLLQPSPSRRRRLAWSLLGAIAWAGLLWSGGRGPIIALAGALLLWWLLAAAPDRRRLLIAGAGQLIAGLALSALFTTERPELGWWHAFERTATATQAANVSALTSTRSEFWVEAYRRGLAAPWFGHGPDAYRFLTPKLDGQQPHNLVLQLWLDLGLLGMLSMLALLATVLAVGLKRAWATHGAAFNTCWLALLTAAVLIGMLDGAFYHLVLFLPALIAAGALFAQLTAAAPVARARAPWRAINSTLLAAAASILLLHTWLFHALVTAPPSPHPQALAPRLLRIFPSTTFGLWRWLDTWKAAHPEEELAWCRWAQQHASNPALFHVRAAQILLSRADRAGAIAELHAARAKAHHSARGVIAAMLDPLETRSP